MIGKLQTNKVKPAVKLFDFIHSVDSIKLAKKISFEQNKIQRNVKIFLQINIDKEEQKSGAKPEDVKNLYNNCLDLKLDVVGLMCLPPINKTALSYFNLVKKLKEELKLKFLSLGMSNDYLEALKVKSNYLRIGTKIFGKRS